MATLSLSSALQEQNGAIKSHNENGGDHDTVLPNLMQKLKMTTKQIKAWSQTSHKLRLAMSKYTEPDPVDPNRLQKCLDKLKMAIKVSSVPAMNERLDAIARQVGLKANWSIDNVYLSSDCFYVEVLLAPNGGVKDVILVHGMNGNLQSCVEMCEVLKKNDFKEFTEHLKGLCQMYQLGGDSKMKTTAFNCLQALEIDLKTLFHISGVKFGASQPQGGSPLLHITKGFVGYLTPRVGGHLMRLTYFVSPYDLLDVEKKQTKELSLKEPLPKDLGLSVTVGIESAPQKKIDNIQRKIQTAPTIMVTDNKITNTKPSDILEEEKFIVFESNLLALFQQCISCHSTTVQTEKIRPKFFGSQLRIRATCTTCQKIWEWDSQPRIGNLMAGNILLSAAILFGGASPTKVLRVLNHMNLKVISTRTFMEHQSQYLQPAVVRVFNREQRTLVGSIEEGEKLVLGGDGRADSPGHCAKFGSYSLMDLKRNKILDIQLVQSNEVTSSNAMEREGLERCLAKLTELGLQVGNLITDRHAQVAKWLRDTYPDIDHRFDVWHIAKGIQKKITAIGKIKDCDAAQRWKRAIVNHVYWTAASTPDGDGAVMAAKYKSIFNHLQDIHVHETEIFPRCGHGEDHPEREWLRVDSKVFLKLSDELLKTRLVNAIKLMSPLGQTSSLEAFHSVLLYWCPKLLAYSYPGMKCSVVPLGNQNSIAILATFVLKLSEPMPMSLILIKQLHNIAGVVTQYADPTAATPLNTLICKFTLDPVTFLQNQAKDGRHTKTKNFIVELPDQHHSYIINDGTNPSDLRDMQGALLSKITFTSPNTVVKIISLLRQQAVYNTLIASCVRNKDAAEPPEAVLFEVTPYTNQKLTVTFEHPAREGVACVELDLTDHAAVKARLHGCPSEEPFCTDDYATKVLQKCLSIPITMRAIMKKAEQWLETHESQKSVSLPPAPSSGPSGGSIFDPMSGIHRHSGVGGGGGQGGSFFPSHRPHQSSYSHQLQSHSILSDLTTTMSAILPHGEGFDMHDKPTKVAQNPMLASLLQHAALAVSTSSLSIPPPSASPMSSPPLASGPKPHKNPMLMNLLQEQNTLTPVAAIGQPVGSMGRMMRRGKRIRSVSVDKSPKRQQSEEEHDFDDFHGHRPLGLHHRLSDTHKMSSHAMDPPKAMHTGELSALLSEIEAPIIPVMKPKRGRPPRLDSSSSQSSISARQSPKTPSTPTVPTTPTFAPPKMMSHSTLSTPEHPSMDELPGGIKAEQLHSRTSMDSDIFLHNSKNMYEDLLPDPPRSNISPEMNRQASFRSQYSSLDINDDAAGFDNDNDDDFGGLPSVSSAIARMGIPTGSEFDDQHRTTTDLTHPLSLSTLTSGPISTAIQAGLETRTDMKMGALDLTVANLAKSMSIPALPIAQRGRPGPNLQGITNLSQSLPPTRPRVPVSKGKPKNFIESSLAFQTEKPKPSKKRGRKPLKDTGGLSDSDAPKTKKLRRPGRLRKERRLPEYSSESSPEPCQDVAQYSSITMAVNEEEPLKMTFKTIRHKPDKEQKLKPKDLAPAPKLKIRAMTSGDSATPSPNPIMRDIKEEKPHVKPEHRLEMPEKIEAVVKSIKTEPPVMKLDSAKDTKIVKDESLPKPHREVSTGHRSEEQANKGTSQELSKGSHDISMVKLEHSAIKPPITKVTAMSHMSKIKSEQMKKSRPVEGGQRPSPSVSKSPIAGFFPKKSLANLPRIPKISKQTSENRQSPNPKTPTTPKPAGSPLPSNKTLLGSSPKKSSWGKGDPSKVGSTKKLVTAQRFSSVSPTGRKPDGMKMGKSFSSGNKSPLTVGQSIRKTGPNILSKSMSTPTQSPNSAKVSAGPVQTPNRNVSSPTTGMSKVMSSQVKPSGTVSPVPKTSAGITSKPPITPTSLAVPSKVPSNQGISVTPTLKASSVVLTSATTSSSVTSSSSSTKTVSSSSSISTVPSSSPVTVRPVSVATTNPTLSLSSTTTATAVNSTTTSITMTTSITPSATASALSVSKSVTSSSVNPVSSSKVPPATGTKTSTTPSNRPPPLVIPTNVKIPTPSVTSPTTPSSVGTPTSAGPNSAKQTTPKSGMRGNRKCSLMGIIDKIKEKNEKVEKTDKVEKVEKSEKVERKGLFSALGSGASGTADSGNGDETDSPEKDTKETDPTEENVAEKSQMPRDKTVVTSKADDTPTKESKATTFPLTKSDSSKTAVPKVTSATNQLPARQPSPSMSLKPSGLNPSPSSQGSSSVKGKSSPKHPSQSRPPKVSTPPLTGSQKRASSPTGKSISIKHSKPSPLSTSGSSTPTSMSSPVKSRPGTSPVPRTRPIILSHSLSTYQSPEKGQQKVTKVQLAMQPGLISHSSVPGQGTSAINVTKGQTNSSQVRVPSPSIKSQPVLTNKPTQDSTKKPTTVMPKPTDTSKSEIKLVTTPKPVKSDQSASMKSKPSTGKEPSSHSQQNNQRSDAKGSLDSGSSKMPSTVSKKAESKLTDPRARKDSQGPSKDKDSDTSKSPKPGVMRTVSKEAKSSFGSGSQDGKTSMKTEQKPTTESVQKPKVTPSLIKSVSHSDREKLKSDEIRKSESKKIVPEIKGTDKQEVSEEVTKTSTPSAKPQGIDFKVPSPAMVPSPKNPAMSPRPVIKPVSSPKPVVAYSPKAPSPHSSTSGVPSPGSAVSPKVPTKRSATPVGNQPPPPQKACAISTPYSPVESDDDFGMIIDMPPSPRSSSQQKPQRSPRPDSRNSNTQTEAGSTSPRSAVAHSPLGQVALSPLGIGKSPASVRSIGSDSISRSPCRIDDDLMDEALTSCIQTEDV